MRGNGKVKTSKNSLLYNGRLVKFWEEFAKEIQLNLNTNIKLYSSLTCSLPTSPPQPCNSIEKQEPTTAVKTVWQLPEASECVRVLSKSHPQRI